MWLEAHLKYYEMSPDLEFDDEVVFTDFQQELLKKLVKCCAYITLIPCDIDVLSAWKYPTNSTGHLSSNPIMALDLYDRAMEKVSMDSRYGH